MGLGRLLCVALPFVLTGCSMICMLIVSLAGVVNQDLYIFRVNTTDLEFDPSALEVDSLLDVDNILSRRIDTDLLPRAPEASVSSLQARQDSTNVTASDLGLADYYDVSLWRYCFTDSDGDTECTESKFNWASTILNDTLDQFSEAAALLGEEITLPDAISEGLETFAVVVKWTQIAYVIALVALAVELFFGVFAACSRAFGCITFIVASITAVLVSVAASLSTAMAVVVVGTVEASAKLYGVRSSLNTSFLAFAWLAAAFALGAGFFWMFTVCCCASGGSSSKRGFPARSIGNDREKNTGSYQPVGDHHEMTPPFYSAAQKYGGNRQSRTDMAYEPYTHNRV